MINFAIKNKKNGMVITSETVEDDVLEAPFLPGDALMMISSFSRNYMPTLVDPSSKIKEQDKNFAKQDLFNFIQVVTGNDDLNPLPFGEEIPYSLSDYDEVFDKFSKDDRTWKEILEEELSEYNIYTVSAFEHDVVNFDIRKLDESFDDFQEIDGLILLEKQFQLEDNYEELLSDWYNGYATELDIYEPCEGNYEYQEFICQMYNSEDDFSYEKNVAKMVSKAVERNCSEFEIDSNAEDWEACEPISKTVYSFV